MTFRRKPSTGRGCRREILYSPPFAGAADPSAAFERFPRSRYSMATALTASRSPLSLTAPRSPFAVTSPANSRP